MVYDAIVEEGEPDYAVKRKYFDSIDANMWYTVKLGKLVKSSKKKHKQKGVDVLMAVDALSRAYQNHYDLGIFVLGDGDYLPLIQAVNDAGKKTLIFCHSPNCPMYLLRCFDMRIYFEKNNMKSWLKKTRKSHN